MLHSEDFIGKTYFCPRKYELYVHAVKSDAQAGAAYRSLSMRMLWYAG